MTPNVSCRIGAEELLKVTGSHAHTEMARFDKRYITSY